MTKHNSHKMHSNSMAAYNQCVNSGGKFSRAQLIIKLMLGSEPLTDNQIAAALGFKHKSPVQPRISDLVKEGVLEECEEKIKEDGRNVRLVQIRTYQQLRIA